MPKVELHFSSSDQFYFCQGGEPHFVATRVVCTPSYVMRRCLLPFPARAAVNVLGVHSSGLNTRAQKMRFRRSSEARCMLTDLCGSLNDLGGFGRDGGSDAVTEVQSSAMDRLYQNCSWAAEITRGVVPLGLFETLCQLVGGIALPISYLVAIPLCIRRAP